MLQDKSHIIYGVSFVGYFNLGKTFSDPLKYFVFNNFLNIYLNTTKGIFSSVFITICAKRLALLPYLSAYPNPKM